MEWLKWKDQYLLHKDQLAELSHSKDGLHSIYSFRNGGNVSLNMSTDTLELCKELKRWLVLDGIESSEPNISLWLMNEMIEQRAKNLEALYQDASIVHTEIHATTQEFPDIERLVVMPNSLVHVETQPLREGFSGIAGFSEAASAWRGQMLARRNAEIRKFVDSQKEEQLERNRSRRANSDVKRLVEQHRRERQLSDRAEAKLSEDRRREEKRERRIHFCGSGTASRIKERETRYLSKRQRHLSDVSQQAPQLDSIEPLKPSDRPEKARNSSIDAIWRRIKDINSAALLIRE
jgi:hypothetical protein